MAKKPANVGAGNYFDQLPDESKTSFGFANIQFNARYFQTSNRVLPKANSFIFGINLFLAMVVLFIVIKLIFFTKLETVHVSDGSQYSCELKQSSTSKGAQALIDK